ncbi:MAG TPA: DMT family transporter [Hyphomicrobiaceae bacterium]|nr:DMT family transporter [Hyphomicrobiaceae bacterium]
MRADSASMQDGAKRRRAANVMAAALWMCGALASFLLIAVAGREAFKTVSTGTIMLYRSWFALLVLLLVVVLSGRGFAQFRTQQLGMHGLRSVIHFGAQFGWFYALSLIPLAQLFAIEFTAPLWTALLAALTLRERLTAWRIASGVLGFAGVLVIAQPGHGEVSVGAVFALLAAMGFAVHYVLTRRLMRGDSAFTVIFYMALFQTALASALLVVDAQIPDTVAMAWILVIAVCGLTAHFSLARAFSLADAAIVAPMDFLRLPLIALVGATLYAEPLNPWVLIGGGMVVLANLINIWSEQRAA